MRRTRASSETYCHRKSLSPLSRLHAFRHSVPWAAPTAIRCHRFAAKNGTAAPCRLCSEAIEASPVSLIGCRTFTMSIDPHDNHRWPEEDTGDESASPSEGRTFFNTWGWPLFGLIAFVIFELTASLMWSSMVFALRFGWKDVYAGWFFWKRDTSWSRSLASGLLYLTLASGKVLVAGSVIMMLIVNVAVPRGQPPGQQIESATVTMAKLLLGAMVSSGVLGTAALVACLRNGQRVWVDQKSYRQAIDGIWPPQDYSTNYGHYACFLTMISLTGFFLAIATVMPFYVAERLMLGKSVWVFLLLITPVLCSIPFFLWGQAWIIKSVVAITPHECWPELLDHAEQNGLDSAG